MPIEAMLVDSVTPAAPPGPSEPDVSVLRGVCQAVGEFGVHFVVAVCGLIFLLKVVPLHQMLFHDLDIKLPAITELAILLSHKCGNYWFLLLPAFLVGDGGLALALQFLPSWLRPLRTIWFSGMLLLAMFALTMGMVAMWMPLYSHFVAPSSPAP